MRQVISALTPTPPPLPQRRCQNNGEGVKNSAHRWRSNIKLLARSSLLVCSPLAQGLLTETARPAVKENQEAFSHGVPSNGTEERDTITLYRGNNGLFVKERKKKRRKA
jgi:hypothetical protein